MYCVKLKLSLGQLSQLYKAKILNKKIFTILVIYLLNCTNVIILFYCLFYYLLIK